MELEEIELEDVNQVGLDQEEEKPAEPVAESTSATPNVPVIEEPSARRKRFNFYARILGVVSFLLELASAVGGILGGAILDSAALIAFGLSSTIDVVSTLFVLWRFFGVDDDTPEKVVDAREKKADIGVAFGVVIIATTICIESAIHLSHHDGPDDTTIVAAIAIASICVYCVLGAIKFYVAYNLRSGALRKDGICSVAVVCLASGILLSSQVYKNDPTVWWLDSAIGLWVSSSLMAIGLYTLYTEREFKYWTWSFWRYYGEEQEEI